MRLIADTHVHIYPDYDIKLALHTLRTNLAQLDDQAICIAFLVERSDCTFFSDFEKNIAGVLSPSIEIRYLKNALHLKEDGYPELYIFPGRQIITNERIEILSLTLDLQIPEGLAAKEVVHKIREAEGVPVLSWAPGKWFFKRKEVVKDLIDSSKPGQLLIGDTTLRPTCWTQPLLMRAAVRKGLAIVSGSDALPFIGEEQVIGQYGIKMDCSFDPNNPVDSIRKVLTHASFQPTLVGKRDNLFSTLRRLFKNARSK